MLQILDYCKDQTISSNAVADKTYLLGGTAQTFSLWTNTLALTGGYTCRSSTTNQIKKSSDATWSTLASGTPTWVTSFSSAGNASITMSTSTASFVGVWYVKQIKTITDSTKPNGTITHQFTITIDYACKTVTDTTMPDITYTMNGQ